MFGRSNFTRRLTASPMLWSAGLEKGVRKQRHDKGPNLEIINQSVASRAWAEFDGSWSVGVILKFFFYLILFDPVDSFY